MRKLGTYGVVLIAASLLTGCAYLQSRDNLNKGIAAYRGADYNKAIEYFKEAIALDPTWAEPQLYLATAYMNMWIPGAQSPENLEYAEKAKAEFKKVLQMKPDDENALAYLATIAYNEATPLPPEEKLAKFDEAEEWHKKRIAVNPKAADAHYSLGVIAYGRWVPVWLEARNKAGMRSEDPGPLKDAEARAALKASHGAILDEGIAELQKALDVDPEYDDAMAYMNLLIRERADLLDTPEEYQAQVEIADGWLQKALDARKIKQEKAEKAAASGITQEQK